MNLDLLKKRISRTADYIEIFPEEQNQKHISTCGLIGRDGVLIEVGNNSSESIETRALANRVAFTLGEVCRGYIPGLVGAKRIRFFLDQGSPEDDPVVATGDALKQLGGIGYKTFSKYAKLAGVKHESQGKWKQSSIEKNRQALDLNQATVV